MQRAFDLVRENGFYYFYFKNDELYEKIPSCDRGLDPYTVRQELDRYGWCRPACDTDDPRAIKHSDHVVPLLLSWLWHAHHRPLVMDVGSHVGRFAIESAHYIRHVGRDTRIVAVEAGPTAELIPHTVALHGLDDYISLLAVAVSDQDGPVSFAFSPNTTNISSIKAESYHSDARLVAGISAKRMISDQADAHTFLMKLDVEGMESAIIDQLAQAFPRKIFIFIAEFTPWKLGSVDAAAAWIERLDLQYHVINVRNFLYDHRMSPLSRSDARAFSQYVIESPYGFSDLLLIPRGLYGARDLVSLLESLEGYGPSAW